MKDIIRKTGSFISSAKSWVSAVLLMPLLSSPVFAAGGIGGSKLATGTEQLINDATSWLLIIAPLVTVVAVIYYLIRKTVSDEMDHKKWNARISTAVVCCIGVVVASVIIKLIVSYYQ